jgi:hypothetical protein
MDDSFITAVAPIDKGDETLFAIDRTADGTRRVIATQDIAKDRRIWAERPIFKMTYMSFNRNIAAKQVAATVKTLSKNYQRAFFSLINKYNKDYPTILGIAKSNSMAINCHTDGIFLQTAILEHSCRPNAFHAFNDATKRLTLHAVRDIKKGEEITINYSPDTAIRVRSERQDLLRRECYFVCHCSLCTAPEPERLASDARCKRLTDIDRQISRGSKPIMAYEEGPLPLIHTMIKLLREEGIADDRISEAYHNAYRIALGNRDYVRSKIFIKRCYRYHVQVEGEDGPAALDVKELVDEASAKKADGDPEHENARDVRLPHKRQGPAFNRWLWRECPMID